jgi:hypothetical protein
MSFPACLTRGDMQAFDTPTSCRCGRSSARRAQRPSGSLARLSSRGCRDRIVSASYATIRFFEPLSIRESVSRKSDNLHATSLIRNAQPRAFGSGRSEPSRTPPGNGRSQEGPTHGVKILLFSAMQRPRYCQELARGEHIPAAAARKYGPRI